MCCKCLAAQNKVVCSLKQRSKYIHRLIYASQAVGTWIFNKRPTNRLGVGVQVADDQVPRTSHQQDDALLADRVDNSKVDQWFPYAVSPVKILL